MNRTTLYTPDHDSVRGRAASLATLLICLLVGMSLAVYAEDNSTDSSDPNGGSQALSVLDGQAFKGKIGANNETGFSDDLWRFHEGIFAAKACRGCEENQYWLRSENGGIRFRAETVCPDPGAVLVYSGLVKNGRIEGTFTWTVGRWYGDTEKQFWFDGRRVENAELAASEAKPSIGSCSEIPNQRPSSPQQVMPSIRDEFLRFP